MLPVGAAAVLALAGLLFLWTVFFKSNIKGNEQKTSGNTERGRKINEIRSLIEEVEKENPELVAEIRSRLIADAKLKRARDSSPEDVSLVVRHWLMDDRDE